MKTIKHCDYCGVDTKHEKIGAGAEGGMVWRCFCCFRTTPVRKYERNVSEAREAAIAWVKAELIARGA